VVKPAKRRISFCISLKIMDRIEDIRLFLRVLDLGSISAAARTLDLSAAVASQRLKRLEEALGVRLLQRSTRQLKVTPEGAALAERGRPLIEDLEALTSDLRQSAEDVSGTLRITLPAAFGRQYMSPLMPEFLARHPRLRISIDLSDAMLDLVAEGFDMGLRIGTLEDSSLVAKRLTDNRRVLCASPDYLERRGAPGSPADLEQHDCLLMVGAKGPRDRWTLISPDGSEITVRVRGPFESNMGEVVRDAVLAGLGISLHSTWHVCDDLKAGRLKVVLPDYRIPDSGIYAVMPQRRLMLPRVRAFIDFIVEKFGDVPPWER
jgi:DNA-binding transcriptional LysR family regulator